MSAREDAAQIAVVFRKHLDAFLKEIGPVSSMAWTMFCISVSRKFYAARMHREEIEK